MLSGLTTSGSPLLLWPVGWDCEDRCVSCVVSSHGSSLYYYLYINVIFNGQCFIMYNTLDCHVNLSETARAERVCCKLKRDHFSPSVSLTNSEPVPAHF